MSFDGWNFRQRHDITSATTLTDYQLQFTIYKGSGTSSGSTIYLNTNCNDDFSDVRFSVDDSTSLSYWIESYTSGVSAVFWVKVPSISTTTLTVYYGKSDAASESNGANTFEFFDDFATGTLDTATKWTVNSAQPYSITGGILTVTGAGDTNDYIRSQSSFSLGHSLMMKSRWNNAIGSSHFGLNGGSTSYTMFWDTTGAGAYSMKSGVSTQSGTPITGSTLYLYEIQRRSSSSLQLIRDGVTLLNPSSTYIPTIDLPINLREYGNGYSQAHDYIIIRKIVETDPTQSTWYTEEFLGTSEIYLTCSSPSGVCPFTASIDLTLLGISTLTDCNINYGDGETESVATISTSPYTFTHLYDRAGTYTVSASGYSYSTLYSTTIPDLIETTYPSMYFTWTPKYDTYYNEPATFEKFYTPVQSYYSTKTGEATITLPDWYGVTAWAVCKHGTNTLVSLFSDYYGGYASIYVYDASNVFATSFGSYGSGNGQFGRVSDIAIDSSNNVFIIDRTNNRVMKFDSSYNYVTHWGSNGSGNGQFSSPCGIAIDSSNNIYVADTGNYRVQKFNSSGTYTSQVGSYGTGTSQFKYPYGIAIDSSNNVYVADGDNGNLQKFTSSLSYTSQIAGLTAYYLNVAIDKLTNYIYVDRYQGTSGGVYIYNSSLVLLSSITTGTTNIISVGIDSSSNAYLLDKTASKYYIYDKPVERWSDANGYEWDFGDGETSTSENPTHIFKTNGTITVTLSAIASDYSRTSYSRNVVVQLRYTIAKYSYLPATIYENDQITFQNNSEYNSTNVSTVTYLWDFGDGTFSTEANPYKVYNYYTGAKTVTLTAIGDGIHKSSTSKVITINPTVYPTVTTDFAVTYNNTDEISTEISLPDTSLATYASMVLDDTYMYIASTFWHQQGSIVTAYSYLDKVDKSGNLITRTTYTDYTLQYLKLDPTKTVLSLVNEHKLYYSDDYYAEVSPTTLVETSSFNASPYEHKLRYHPNTKIYGRTGSYVETEYMIVYTHGGDSYNTYLLMYDEYSEISEWNAFTITSDGNLQVSVNYVGTYRLNTYDEDLVLISSSPPLSSYLYNLYADDNDNLWYNANTRYEPLGTSLTHTFKFLDETIPTVEDCIINNPNNAVLKTGYHVAWNLKFSNEITFSDTSTGEPIEWYWEFGDGSNSNERNPTHIYNEPGTYSVTLYSSNDHNSNSITHTVFVSEPIPTVTISSSIADDNVAPTRMHFIPTTTVRESLHEEIISYLWDFGDGTTSTLKYPSKYYMTYGSHTITLTITNNYGRTASTTYTFYIGIAPHAAFKPSYLNIVNPPFPYNVAFTDMSYPTDIASTTYLWSFGDTATSSDTNPSHAYSTYGMYDVSLTITNPYGTDTITYNDAIRITRKSKTFREIFNAVDTMPTFRAQIFNEVASYVDPSIIYATILPVETFRFVQTDTPATAGIDEWGILNLSSYWDTLGSKIYTTLNEWGHKIIKHMTSTSSDTLTLYHTKEFREDLVLTDEWQFGTE